MTVKELKQKLENVPDDMRVVICREDTNIGGFFYEDACEHDSGVVDTGEPDENMGEIGEREKVFSLTTCQCEQVDSVNEN